MDAATQLRPHQADAMLIEYVRIRYEMTGAERIVALTEWATQVDKIYRREAIARPSAQQ